MCHTGSTWQDPITSGCSASQNWIEAVSTTEKVDFVLTPTEEDYPRCTLGRGKQGKILYSKTEDFTANPNKALGSTGGSTLVKSEVRALGR